METEKSVNTKYSNKGVEIKCYLDSYFNLLFIVNAIQNSKKNGLVKQIFNEIRNLLNLQTINCSGVYILPENTYIIQTAFKEI